MVRGRVTAGYDVAESLYYRHWVTSPDTRICYALVCYTIALVEVMQCIIAIII